MHARKYSQPIDHLTFKYNVLSLYRDQAEVMAATAKLAYGEELEQDREIGPPPADGILVHGLYMDGCRSRSVSLSLSLSLFSLSYLEKPGPLRFSKYGLNPGLIFCFRGN